MEPKNRTIRQAFFKSMAAPFGIPELLAAACVVGVQAWKRTSLISILAGTIVYMVLVQGVF